ncbi:unnamed protein product [Closterium sp. Naga37s-1]|nr:unnamed protein product [Closterium sp. Naga37s-1]
MQLKEITIQSSGGYTSTLTAVTLHCARIPLPRSQADIPVASDAGSARASGAGLERGLGGLDGRRGTAEGVERKHWVRRRDGASSSTHRRLISRRSDTDSSSEMSERNMRSTSGVSRDGGESREHRETMEVREIRVSSVYDGREVRESRSRSGSAPEPADKVLSRSSSVESASGSTFRSRLGRVMPEWVRRAWSTVRHAAADPSDALHSTFEASQRAWRAVRHADPSDALHSSLVLQLPSSPSPSPSPPSSPSPPPPPSPSSMISLDSSSFSPASSLLAPVHHDHRNHLTNLTTALHSDVLRTLSLRRDLRSIQPGRPSPLLAASAAFAGATAAAADATGRQGGFAKGAANMGPSVRSASDARNKGTDVPGDAAAADRDVAFAMSDVATANSDVVTANSDVATANSDVAGAREGGEATAADEGAFSGFGGDARYFKRLGGGSNASCSSADTVEGLSTVFPAELSGKLRILLEVSFSHLHLPRGSYSSGSSADTFIGGALYTPPFPSLPGCSRCLGSTDEKPSPLSWALTFSGPSWREVGGGEGSDEERRRVKVFGQHGREAITTELGFNLLKVLVGEREVVEKGAAEKSDESGGGEEVTEGEEKEGKGEGKEEKSEEVEEKGEGGREGGGKEGSEGGIRWEQLALIWPHLVITIVPMENVNGRKKVEAGELCERRNGRGVDINRNWDCDWGVKEKDYNPLEEAPGTHAFSEPEAEAMRRLAVWFRPHVWVNVHSGMEALFTPLDHRGDGVDANTLAAMHSLLERLDASHCGARCVIGSGGGFVGYFAHGTATDWMYDVLRVPLAFTFETFGDESFPTSDCFPLFNPITTDKFQVPTPAPLCYPIE